MNDIRLVLPALCWWSHWPPPAASGRASTRWRCPVSRASGPGAYTIQAQMPDVDQPVDQNSRVRVDDVTVGNVTEDRASGLERAGHHEPQRRTWCCPPTRPPPSGRPACWDPQHIELAAPTDTAPAGQAEARSGDPAGVQRRLPDHRADAGRDLVAAQRRWGRPGPGHHHRRSAPPSPAVRPTCAA